MKDNRYLDPLNSYDVRLFKHRQLLKNALIDYGDDCEKILYSSLNILNSKDNFENKLINIDVEIYKKIKKMLLTDGNILKLASAIYGTVYLGIKLVSEPSIS